MLKGPDFVAEIAEYNSELTGFDPRLREIDSETFVYGGNAYYIINYWAPKRNWQVWEKNNKAMG